ncbi:hypothetical protein DSECCO2_560860 [anaerobic digester metagenome]
MEEDVVQMVDDPGKAFSCRSLRDAEDMAEEEVACFPADGDLQAPVVFYLDAVDVRGIGSASGDHCAGVQGGACCRLDGGRLTVLGYREVVLTDRRGGVVVPLRDEEPEEPDEFWRKGELCRQFVFAPRDPDGDPGVVFDAVAA